MINRLDLCHNIPLSTAVTVSLLFPLLVPHTVVSMDQFTTGPVEWNGGMDRTGMEWNGTASHGSCGRVRPLPLGCLVYLPKAKIYVYRHI